jgi:hypothetical protein
VVFTLPHELNRLCQRNSALLYNLLFHSVAETLLEVAADPRQPWCRDRVPGYPAQLGPEPAAPSTHPLPRSGRRPFTRSQLLDTTEVSLFSSARCPQKGLSRQVS